MKPNFKIKTVLNSYDKPQVEWDGKGKNPVLGLTREEILAANEAVTGTHQGTKADSQEKTPQPEFSEQVRLAKEDAEQKQATFIEYVSEKLSTQKP